MSLLAWLGWQDDIWDGWEEDAGAIVQPPPPAPKTYVDFAIVGEPPKFQEKRRVVPKPKAPRENDEAVLIALI